MKLTRRASWACTVVCLPSCTNAQNAVLYKLFMWAIRSPVLWEQCREQVLTVSLPPREIVSDELLRRIQDNPPVKGWGILQAHSWEMFRPVEHIGRRELGYDRRQYFGVPPVTNTARFLEQEAGGVDALSATGAPIFRLKSTRLNSSDSPKAKVMSANVSMTELAASSMSCKARASFGFANSWSCENL